MGRRRRRIRGTLAGAAAVVAVVAVCGLLLTSLRPDDRDSVAGPGGGFDPLTRSLHVGSAGGFTPQSYETGRTRQQVRLRLDRPAPGHAGQAT